MTTNGRPAARDLNDLSIDIKAHPDVKDDRLIFNRSARGTVRVQVDAADGCDWTYIEADQLARLHAWLGRFLAADA